MNVTKHAPGSRPDAADSGFGPRAFVVLVAAVMACNALGIDAMLPALPDIGKALGVTRENDRQLVISAYSIGFGAAQIVYGPLADRFGRRALLATSLSMFALLSMAAGLTTSFAGLLGMRLLQGIASAGGRVLVISIVRDCYSGRAMARVMSTASMVFLVVPILAPSVGQFVLLFSGWRTIFFLLGGFAGVVALVVGLRIRETLHPAHRRPLSPALVGSAVGRMVLDRTAIGYTLASAMVFGGLLGFINSIQQIFADLFHAPGRFPLVFACVSGSMAVAAFTNARIVERVGSRRVSHTALCLFLLTAAAHVGVAASGRETVASFTVLMCLQMFCFGLMGANFNAMAMDTVGDIAGTASSVQGFISTCGGATIGLLIGQAFDGTSLPMAIGFLASGLGALLAVLLAERGRLFRPHHADTAA